nr:7-carboxy-7-deazaguanine synthase QueE [Acidobacteriota bacterium]
DWEYALDVIARYELERRAGAILISPVWGEVDLQEMAEWVATSGLDVRMQLQLHKQIWGPEARGV